MIEFARTMAEHVWTATSDNLVADCLPPGKYESDWQAGQTRTGLPYDWGGMDSPEEFDSKLANGVAAGSHRRDWEGTGVSPGVPGCTAGVDCSGFVSLAWRASRKYGTATIHQIADSLEVDVFADLRPGDALNKPGSHIVLFVEYRPDGEPTVYESAGGRKGVVLNDWSPWARYEGYVPLRYREVRD